MTLMAVAAVVVDIETGLVVGIAEVVVAGAEVAGMQAGMIDSVVAAGIENWKVAEMHVMVLLLLELREC